MKYLGLLLLCFLQSCSTGKTQKKINGISFVASREQVVQTHVDELKHIFANSAAIMPFGFIPDMARPEVYYNSERQWFGETKRGAKQYIELLHNNNISVMLKPQIWIDGIFTGSFFLKTEEEWKHFEDSYEAFILSFAQLAQETNTEIFCIGTELEKFIAQRPEFWFELIRKTKLVYNGKLTYAANWDEYKRTPFWDQMDFIGVDAYFPLSEVKTPTTEMLASAWKPWKMSLKNLSKEHGKPILFTEFGYRSMDYTAQKPWLVDRHDENVNLEGQANALEAIFTEIWRENWFAGGYVWKWFLHHEKAGGDKDNRFTPQNKPAQQVIKNFYGRYTPNN